MNVSLEESLDPPVALPEHSLWIAVIERAVLDACDGGVHAHSARAWLLDSPEFLLVAFYAGSADPETLRAQIRAALDRSDRRPRTPRGSRLQRVTMLTAPPGMPLWEIVEKSARAARASV